MFFSACALFFLLNREWFAEIKKEIARRHDHRNQKRLPQTKNQNRRMYTLVFFLRPRYHYCYNCCCCCHECVVTAVVVGALIPLWFTFLLQTHPKEKKKNLKSTTVTVMSAWTAAAAAAATTTAATTTTTAMVLPRLPCTTLLWHCRASIKICPRMPRLEWKCCPASLPSTTPCCSWTVFENQGGWPLWAATTKNTTCCAKEGKI